MPPLSDGFSIEIIYKPLVPNNMTNFHVFNDDHQIHHFMENADIFKDVAIDEDENDKALREAFEASKGNIIPKGLVSPEKLYDLQNCFRGPVNTKTQSSKLSYEQVNLGTHDDLKYVNLDTCCSP